MQHVGSLCISNFVYEAVRTELANIAHRVAAVFYRVPEQR